MSIWLDAKQIADRLGVTLAVLQRIAELAKLQGIIGELKRTRNWVTFACTNDCGRNPTRHALFPYIANEFA